MVVVVGIDVHKDSHCAAAVDQVGRQLGAARTFRTTDAGNLQLLRWALLGYGQDGAEVVFAVVAMHAGVAPIPASSGRTNRHRPARGGNRQLNCALHRIAVTQIRLDGPGRTYYQRRTSSGDTSMEALRALKRRLARIVFTLLQPTNDTAAAPLPQAA